jgi:hypothetical protein
MLPIQAESPLWLLVVIGTHSDAILAGGGKDADYAAVTWDSEFAANGPCVLDELHPELPKEQGLWVWEGDLVGAPAQHSPELIGIWRRGTPEELLAWFDHTEKEHAHHHRG